MLKQLLTGSSIIALVLVSSLPAQSQAQSPAPQTPAQGAPQTQVSSEELQKFAKSVKQILTIEQGAQTKMAQAVKAEGLSEERFMAIYKVQQNPQAQPKPTVTSQEKQKYDKAFTKLGQIQQDTQSQMAQVLKQQGLEVKRFNEILVAVRQNPDLREKVQQLIKG